MRDAPNKYDYGDEHHIKLQEGGDLPLWTNTQEHVDRNLSEYDDLSLTGMKNTDILGNLERAGMDRKIRWVECNED